MDRYREKEREKLKWRTCEAAFPQRVVCADQTQFQKSPVVSVYMKIPEHRHAAPDDNFTWVM